MPPLKPLARMKISASTPKQQEVLGQCSAPRLREGAARRCAAGCRRRAISMMRVRSPGASLAMADRPLAMNSPWLRWLPKMWSAGSSASAAPTAAAFLADGEMRRALVGEGDVLIAALGLEGAEHRLELADDHHVAEDLDQRLLAARLALFGKGPRIGMQRDLREGERAGFAEVLGRDGNGLGHGVPQSK